MQRDIKEIQVFPNLNTLFIPQMFWGKICMWNDLLDSGDIFGVRGKQSLPLWNSLMGEVDFNPRITQINIKSQKRTPDLETFTQKNSWLKFSRDESKPRVFFLWCKGCDRNIKGIIQGLGNFLLGGILNLGFKTCGLWTIGHI